MRTARGFLCSYGWRLGRDFCCRLAPAALAHSANCGDAKPEPFPTRQVLNRTRRSGRNGGVSPTLRRGWIGAHLNRVALRFCHLRKVLQLRV